MGMRYPDEFDRLIGIFKQLPGIGGRGAERVLLRLLTWSDAELADLGNSLSQLHKNIGNCPECGALAEYGKLCPVCADESRDNSKLCVVENTTQLIAVEKSGRYRGRYLVLGGKLSPLNDTNGEKLNIKLLREKALSTELEEIILALSSDVEGRATSCFLVDLLKGCKAKITRPALGLPPGADLTYVDSETIGAAFCGRTPTEE